MPIGTMRVQAIWRIAAVAIMAVVAMEAIRAGTLAINK